MIAAVSGGSDSTALLLLLQDHLLRLQKRGNAPPPRLIAVTVDHALRPESVREAAAVARLCAGKGIEHRIMRWSEPKPSSGIPAAAREARYRLLALAAREAGTDIIFTGHTADDQAETVFMRQARNDGLGLAGMAPATLYDGSVWLLRPLLGQRRLDLKDYLISRGVAWMEDATNADVRFERPRARARLTKEQLSPRMAKILYDGTIWEDIFGSREERGGEAASLLALARWKAARRAELANRAAILVLALARKAAPGLLHLDPSFARYRDQPAALHALRALLATVGGTEFLPPAQRAEALLARLAEPPFRGTLSRTLIAARRDGVWLARETRGLPDVLPVENDAIWDGRFRIQAEGDAAAGLHIAARRFADIADAVGAGLPSSLARAASASQPVFFSPASAKIPAAAPKGVSLVPVAAPYARFLPSFDMEIAAAVGELVGAPQIPAAPFQEHIESKA